MKPEKWDAGGVEEGEETQKDFKTKTLINLSGIDQKINPSQLRREKLNLDTSETIQHQKWLKAFFIFKYFQCNFDVLWAEGSHDCPWADDGKQFLPLINEPESFSLD